MMAMMIFQEGGAPAHYSYIVTEFPDDTFPRLWIEKQCPPRSPDLKHLDFYFWGHVKQIVCSVRIYNIQNLK
jgi:hypothetical protein